MLSKRERTIAIATGAAVGLLGLNYFLLDPLLADRDEMAQKHGKLASQLHEDIVTLDNSRQATHHWEKLRASGASGASGGLGFLRIIPAARCRAGSTPCEGLGGWMAGCP